MKIYNERLKILMAENNISSNMLAILSGYAHATILGYITKDRSPRVSTIVKFAQIFNVKVDYLLGFTDKK